MYNSPHGVRVMALVLLWLSHWVTLSEANSGATKRRMLLPPATAACNLSWKVPEKMFLKVPGLQEHWFFLVLTKIAAEMDLRWEQMDTKWTKRAGAVFNP